MPKAMEMQLDEAELKRQRKLAKKAAAATADEAPAEEVDEAEAKRQRKAAKRAAAAAAASAVEGATDADVNEAANSKRKRDDKHLDDDALDEAEAKKLRKAAKKAAAAAAAEEAAPAGEADEAEAKRLRKAAKKAAKEAAATPEEANEVDDEEIDHLHNAKRQRKALKKAAKEVAAAAEEDVKPPKKAKVDAAKVEDAPKVEKESQVAEEAATDEPEFFKVFIKGLPWSTTEDALRKDFEECGEIVHFQMPLNEAGKPKGFAFVQYKTKAGFDAALKYDGTEYGGRTLGVAKGNDPRGHAGKQGAKGKGKEGKAGDWTCPNCQDLVFARNSQCRGCGTARPGGSGGPGPTEITHENTIFIKGLPWAVTQEMLEKDFSECGEIETSRIPLNDEGKPRGIAFIKFKAAEGVEAALKFDNTDYGGRRLEVCKSGEGKGGKDGKGSKGGKGKGADGKGKDGKGKSKGKGKAPSANKAAHTGCIVAAAGDKKTFDDSDDDN